MTETIFMSGVLAICFIIGMAGIWNNWIWIGKNGFNLPYNLRPGFFKFWFRITPRFLLGMKTGMEDITL